MIIVMGRKYTQPKANLTFEEQYYEMISAEQLIMDFTTNACYRIQAIITKEGKDLE